MAPSTSCATYSDNPQLTRRRIQDGPSYAEAGWCVTSQMSLRFIPVEAHDSDTPPTAMQKSRHYYFRWTPRTARIAFTYMVVIPAICGYAAYKSDVSRRRRHCRTDEPQC